MRYLIPIAFLILPVLAFAAGQDAGAAAVAADPSGYGGPVTDWNEWARSSPIGQLVTGAFVSAMMLGITKVRGEIKDRPGTLGIAVLALAGGIASSIIGGTPLDPKLAEVTVVVLLTAIGGYTFVKKLAFPSDTPTRTASGEIDLLDVDVHRYRKPSDPPPLPLPPTPEGP